MTVVVSGLSRQDQEASGWQVDALAFTHSTVAATLSADDTTKQREINKEQFVLVEPTSWLDS